MGVVYGATGPGGDRAAVKVIRTDLSDEAWFRERFTREIRLMERVRARCAAPLVAAGPEDVPPWYATAYVPGPTLSRRITGQGPMPPARARALAVAMAEAIEGVHAAGIVHRDLKPANVILAPDGPKVIDFGIARAVDETRLTMTGELFGSPGWMSPERYRGHAGPEDDVFAWGALVAYAATGEPPFGRGGAETMMYRVLNEEPRLDALPPELAGPVALALSKDPAERPSPGELIRMAAAAGADGIGGDDGDTIVAAVLARDWPAPDGVPVVRSAAPEPAGRAEAPVPGGGGPRPPAPPPGPPSDPVPPPRAGRRGRRGASAAIAGAAAIVLAASVGAWVALRSPGGGPGGPQGGEGPGSLTVWLLEQPSPESAEAAAPLFEGAERRYRQDHPDTAVEVEYIPRDRLSARLSAAAAAGEGPDVVEVSISETASWAEQGALLGLDAYTAGWEEGGRLHQGAVEATRYRGEQYGIPWRLTAASLVYRSDWLDAIGAEPPRTWDDLLEVASAIEEEYDAPGFAAPTDSFFALSGFVRAAGGEIAAQEDGRWQGRLSSAESRRAIEFYTGLPDQDGVSSSRYTGLFEMETMDELGTDELGMVVSGPWARTALRQGATVEAMENLGAAPLPGPDGPAASPASGTALAVPAGTPHPEYAFDLVALLAGEELGPRCADASEAFPAYPDLLEDSAGLDDPLRAATAERLPDAFFPPAAPGWPAVHEDGVIHEALTAVTEGDDPAKALGKADADLTGLLNPS